LGIEVEMHREALSNILKKMRCGLSINQTFVVFVRSSLHMQALVYEPLGKGWHAQPLIMPRRHVPGVAPADNLGLVDPDDTSPN
jgi:hypothetical protein